MMKDLIELFREAEMKVAREQGGFALFVLCEREDAPGQWDVVASAPWLDTDREGIATLIRLLGTDMSLTDWFQINRVVPMRVSDPLVQTTTTTYDVEHGSVELPFPKFGGVSVTRTVLITANRRLAHIPDTLAVAA